MDDYKYDDQEALEEYFTDASSIGRAKGPFGIDPLHFSAILLSLLLLFVLYLLTPRGFRVSYFHAYPKRHAWSARARSSRSRSGGSTVGGSRSVMSNYSHSMVPPSSTIGSGSMASHHNIYRHQGNMVSPGSAYYHPPGSGMMSNRNNMTGSNQQQQSMDQHHHSQSTSLRRDNNEETITFGRNNATGPGGQRFDQQQITDLEQNDEIVISAAMQQLRDPGVLIVAHGSRGKPKTVRLQLTESAITWRTETRKKNPNPNNPNIKAPPKIGKLHQVPLSHIMYVDVGKQTTALRRVENAGVHESLCFSLLTKEGSLDLEANSPRERDALVSCFSLVLDEVHAQNWRDIYRGPSSEMPSSFDDFDTEDIAGERPNNNNTGGMGREN